MHQNESRSLWWFKYEVLLMVEFGYNISVSEKITTGFAATFATFVNDPIIMVHCKR